MNPLYTNIAILLLGLINVFTMLKMKNEIKNKVQIWIAKQRGKPIKEVILFGLDNTLYYSTATPDTDVKTIKIKGDEYQYDPKSILYAPQHQIQTVVAREGTAGIINPNEWKPGDIDPRIYSTGLKIAKERGRTEARQEFGNFKTLLYIIIAGVAIAAIIGVLNYQKLGDVVSIVNSLAAMIPKPVVLGSA